MRQWCCGRTDSKEKISHLLKPRFDVCACSVLSARFGFVWAFDWNCQLKLSILFQNDHPGSALQSVGIERAFLLHENKASHSLLTHMSGEKPVYRVPLHVYRSILAWYLLLLQQRWVFLWAALRASSLQHGLCVSTAVWFVCVLWVSVWVLHVLSCSYR